MQLNENGMRLILRFEVGGGEAYYNRFLQSPTWPGGFSGVTIGVGYDLGYNTSTTIRNDWSSHLDGQVIQRLLQCAGKKAAEGKAALNAVKNIVVSWQAAFAVYQAVTIPKYIELTKTTFPGVEDLRENCQGALISLVFNRGGSLAGDRRKEMRAIRDLVPAKNFDGIATQIRLMKRLWIGTDIEKGMTRRRDAEADLVLLP